MKKPTVFFTLFAAFFFGGCQYAGIVSLLGTPSQYEQEIAAEYDLSKQKDQKLLVLVDQPGWVNTSENLRYYLTRAINKNLKEMAKIQPEHLVDYNDLSEFRSNKSDFSLLPPVEVGRAFDANMVLFVVVEDYHLRKIAQEGGHEGFLAARVVLLDTATEGQLWPEAPKSKSIKVGFETEGRGQTVAAQRLVAACAYCMTRYLYNCPKSKFSVTEDKSRIGWQEWER